ncbi:MAG: 4'-phosphopantetheinyl transferase superfamily protein [Cyanobacteria bacterium J06621_8]
MESAWQKPSHQPELEDNQVHVWCADLDVPPSELDRLARYLSPDEQVRASKFKFPQLQSRFTAARGILRELLGNYLQIAPSEVKFDYGDRGKPRLANSPTQLEFNLSHSQGYALYGFTYNSAIGVDLEQNRTMKDALNIAQRFFTPREYELLQNTPIANQQTVFFALWTAKEAYLKAVGTGLSGSLEQVEIGTNPLKLLAVDGSQANAASWFLVPCSPAADFLGAIAINHKISLAEFSFWSWHQSIKK